MLTQEDDDGEDNYGDVDAGNIGENGETNGLTPKTGQIHFPKPSNCQIINRNRSLIMNF